MSKQAFRFALISAFAGHLIGCATPQMTLDPAVERAARDNPAKSELRESIREGQTSRADVLARLGTPFARFEEDRILAYVLVYSSTDQALIPASVIWRPQEGYRPNRYHHPAYELILVFGPDGLLQSSSMIQRLVQSRYH